MAVRGSPPLARGKPETGLAMTAKTRITPACAGKTVLFIRLPDFPKDHPRLRGENKGEYELKYGCEGSPPLARGKQAQLSAFRWGFGITPACAGKTI